MIVGCVEVCGAGFLGLEINSKVSIVEMRMPGEAPNIPTGDRIDTVVQVIRFVQPMTLFLIARHGVGGDPVAGVEIENGCGLSLCEDTIKVCEGIPAMPTNGIGQDPISGGRFRLNLGICQAHC